MTFKHLAFLCTLFILSCQGPQGPQGSAGKDSDIENQLRFSVKTSLGLGHSNSDWFIFDQKILRDFNISDYTGIDSAFFVVAMKSDGAHSECSAMLYNMTDSADISGSQVSLLDSSWQYVESNNILTEFPKKKINLCLKAKNQYDDFDSGSAEISFFMLILYRNH